MKLLGWMHRKFRQNSGDAIRDQVVSGPTCNCLCARPSLDGHSSHHRRPMASQGLYVGANFSDAAAIGDAGEEDTELFEGFLTIGTLGSFPFHFGQEEVVVMPNIFKPESAESIVEKEATTAADLLVVGAELEKVLAAEAEKGGSDLLSSARPSHSVAGGYPLQEFLFASAVDAAEKADARKERRASLGELFMMAQVAEDQGKEGGAEDARRKDRVHVMVKKMLRRRGSSGGDASSGEPGDGGVGELSHAAGTKFNKLLRIFHRKVHPENTVALKTVKKSSKNKIKDDIKSCNGENYYNNADDGYDMIRTSKVNCGNEGVLNYKSRSLGSRSDSNGSRECWIKTDSDYLVLEL